MKICDLCFNVSGSSVPAATQISIGPLDAPDEVYDACQSCAMAVKEMMGQPKEERKSGPGRPRKAA